MRALRHYRAISLSVMAVFLADCGQAEDPTATASTEAVEPAASGRAASEPGVASSPDQIDLATRRQVNLTLPERLNCLHEEGGLLLIGHRGGPTRDYPENAIETLERTWKAGIRAMEIDIAQTRDGELVLMHDDDLDRTSTGTGLVADHTWAEISKLKLETYSKETKFAPPKLEAALAWAVKTGAILELDKKRSAPWAPIIAAVRAAKAENNVFLITYTDEQAMEVHKAAPDLVITATVENSAQLDRLLKGGVQASHLIAWTGVSEPNPALWKAMSARGVESAFGTVGARATSLDGKYWEDDDGSEYEALAEGGLPILVTGITDKVSRQLAGPIGRAEACGL